MGARLIDCPIHGLGTETFVCQHVVRSLETHEPVGFFGSGSSPLVRPHAWCAECHRRHEAAGYRWVGEAKEKLGAKLLCHQCYDSAKALNLGTAAEG